jgi:hypothetical protein
MRTIETYLEHADELAQEVVNAWGVNMQAGNGPLLTDDFNALLDKACRYRDAKGQADNRREFQMLSERDTDTEKATRQEFAAAYKRFWENHQAAA